MTQSGTIVVQNLTLANNVSYLVGGMVPGSGIYGLASGNLGNPSSGTYSRQISVSGFELYSVQFWPVGDAAVTIAELAVNSVQPTIASLAVTIE